ncbi:S-adenosyl-l-methionine hydroxide adenosyltransferase family protein [Salarchaeum sp. JOR-1]|uniref:SAM hydrolase/SAM-dependent halogenase family protein n=1 Tax=Salarchaeum sp. JOR-1 TaxID=2599399 RepID=UPI001198C851|nr:SAM-dependent chlorinase/fluorinase [Salarchaeum sp. JOR-1]QDX39988.1 SAM-dependent chlorinase/fluorinase [Salarchaeum sp. JOR-1]
MITLTSDFGSPYPAAMKGVILQRTDARLVDVAHDLPRQDVRAAAFWLREVVPYYPPAVHLVVVDPGVGTDRAAVVVRVGDHAFVAPDNGVVRPAARALDGDIDVFEIDDSDAASSTFHGRDVFAPAAADVHEAGVENIENVAGITPAADCVDLALPDATVEGDVAHGEVLVVDDFGNAITNVPGEFVADAASVRVNGERAPVEPSYAHVGVGERLVTVASHGNVELAVNQGRGADAFGVQPGDSVDVKK